MSAQDNRNRFSVHLTHAEVSTLHALLLEWIGNNVPRPGDLKDPDKAEAVAQFRTIQGIYSKVHKRKSTPAFDVMTLELAGGKVTNITLSGNTIQESAS